MTPDGWPAGLTMDVHPRIADAWLAADSEVVGELEAAVAADLVFEVKDEPTLRLVSPPSTNSGATRAR